MTVIADSYLLVIENKTLEKGTILGYNDYIVRETI